MSIFRFERSSLRWLGLSLWGEEPKTAAKPQPEGSETDSDPYLSQTARFLMGGTSAASADSTDSY